MTKFNLLTLLLLAAMALPQLSVAQLRMGAWGDTSNAANNNYYINYAGGRVSISSPSSLAGPVTYTIANDGGGNANEWGGSIAGLPSPLLNVPIVKADPYEACGTLTNGSAISGNIALIKRGNCEFGAKADYAEQAGAVAVIIVNNVPGPPVGMGAGAKGTLVSIPVIMVSDVDGAAIEAALGSGSVTMSMSIWSNGYTADMGFVDRGLSLWHSYSIPLNQIKNATSVPYKGFNGAVIGNFGSTTMNDVVIKTTVRWTPTGGSTTVVREDTMNVGTFAPQDSILTPFKDMEYNLAPTSTGRYDVEYELSSSTTDDFLGDNKASYSFYVTDQLYSKGRYDFTNKRPYSSIGYRLGSGNEFTWGPMMFIEKANYIFENVQVALSKPNAQTDNQMAGTFNVFVWKWEDANGDSIIIGSECEIVGLGSKTFVNGDTSGQVHTVDIKLADDGVSSVATEANTWYWVSVGVPRDLFLAVDGVSNYFVRSWGRANATNDTREPYAPMFAGAYNTFMGSATPLQHYPFEGYYWLEDSIRFSQQKNGLVPSVPLQLSLFPVDVAETKKDASLDIRLFPNPATDVLNVSLALDKPAKQVSYTVMNINGATIKNEARDNVTNDQYTIATSELAAGSYFVLIDVDGRSVVRKFSVVK